MNVAKKISTVIMALLIGLFIGFTPISVHAEEGGTSISDVKVEVSDDGSLSVSGGGMSSTAKSGKAWTDLITKYKGFIVGISGIATVSMILFFVMNAMKLGASSGNSQGRTQAIVGLVFSGIAAALLGAVSVIVGFFYSALK